MSVLLALAMLVFWFLLWLDVYHRPDSSPLKVRLLLGLWLFFAVGWMLSVVLG